MNSLALTAQAVLPLPDFDRRTSSSATKRKKQTSRRPGRNVDPKLHAALCDPARVVFLDVETTGLSHHYDEVTLVGWVVDDVYRVFIPGDDPTLLLSALRDATTLVTFNGTLFDLKFLLKTFRALSLPPNHIDLRYLSKRVSLVGGQKAIEQKLGLSLRDEVKGVDGAEAVLLWHRYLRGDLGSLRRLIDYNRCDVLAMRFILDEVLDRLGIDRDLWNERARFGERACTNSGWSVPTTALPMSARLHRSPNSYTSLFKGTPAEFAVVVGIDLTGSEVRRSGWCILKDSIAETAMLSTDDEMVERIKAIRPTVVSIDSPLCLPYGRNSVSDDDPARAEFGIMRICERELKRRGINVYPSLLPSMQGLTARGIRLASRIRALGVPVIESYPGAAQDIMGIPRKGTNQEFLKQGLADFGVSGAYVTTEVTHDELDAITSAIVGLFLMAGKFEALGSGSEDPLIVPKLSDLQTPLVVGISGRICAGKTTSARSLERKGFAYSRFSMVIDRILREKGETPTRESRQRVGLEIHRTKGQRWLCEQVLGLTGDAKAIVIDGLRFLEDRAFLTEKFGGNFVHLHIVASADVRRRRYQAESQGLRDFDAADSDDVENEVDKLEQVVNSGGNSGVTLVNEDSIDALEKSVENAIKAFRDSLKCQSR
ncbi:MAG: ribonuclease H-like domain-containing protein [Rhodospirillaceae bacterium]